MRLGNFDIRNRYCERVVYSEKIVIEGGKKLSGGIQVHGAKNSALPILAASLICQGTSVIHNCPCLTDVDAAIKILEYLGCKVKWEGNTVIVDASVIERSDIPDHLMHEMRSSIVFLGSITASMGRADLSLPGGCEIGLRPIDLHLSAMRKFGMQINEEYGRLVCTCGNGMHSAEIALAFPSVGATENIMLFASVLHGKATIINAAREPEIVDLANYLNACGAKISGAGEGVIHIEGVPQLHGAVHSVIPDRITATTYMCAAAATGSELTLHSVNSTHLAPVISVFEQMGCGIQIYNNTLRLSAPERLNPTKTIRTMPYPGFPTDAQAPLLAAATLADGTSVFVENIFECRYKHVGELIRLGAAIKVEERVAVVSGVPFLTGAKVEARDLRGGASLIVAGLAARGTTEITGLNHIQ